MYRLSKVAFVSPEKHFKKSLHTLPCVCTWKIWSNRKSFPLTVKCGWLKCKIDYRSILPSNHFQKKNNRTTPKERELKHEHTPHMVQNPSPSSPQPSFGQPSQALASPDCVAPPPRSHCPTAQITRRPSFLFFLSSSSTSPPSRSEPCISFSSSPPKTDLVLDPPKNNLVAVAEDRRHR